MNFVIYYVSCLARRDTFQEKRHKRNNNNKNNNNSSISFHTHTHKPSSHSPVFFVVVVVVKGPAADATGAPQPSGLLCNLVMKIISFLFRGMEHRGKTKYSEKNLSQCHLVHQKSHRDRPWIEPGPPRWEACDYPPEPWHGRPVLFGVSCPLKRSQRTISAAVISANPSAFPFFTRTSHTPRVCNLNKAI